MTLGITVRNPLTVVLFVCFYLVGLKIPELGEIHGFIREALAVVVGAAAALLLRERVVDHLNFENGHFSVIAMFIILLGYWLLARLVLKFIIEGQYGKRKIKLADVSDRDDTFSGLVKKSAPYDKAFGKKIFITTAVVCLIFYLPYFLYEFPGVMTADSLDQFDQVTYVTPLYNHHPVVHTLLIKLFYNIGLWVTGYRDKIVAISFYTAFQMIFVCLCNAAVVTETLKLMNKKSYRIAGAFIFFYAVMPFNAVFSVTIWKDVPFAGVTMLLCVVLAEIIRKGKDSSIPDFVAFTVLSILFCLFRSNALYAYLVFGLFFLLRMRKRRFVESIVSVIVCVLVVFIIKAPVFNSMRIVGPDFTESLSVPIQQVARVLVNDRQVDESDLALIDNVIDRTYIKELYAPDFADNIKELVRAGHPGNLEKNKLTYLKLWLRLGMKYPGDYIAAWFDQVGGYFYTDVPYTVGDIDGIMPNIHGLAHSPIIGGKFIKVKEIMIKLQDFMPIYGIMFTAAIYTWALIYSLTHGLRKKKPVLMQVLMLLLVATLLVAAPMVDFRYAYAIVMTWPLWFVGTNKL